LERWIAERPFDRRASIEAALSWVALFLITQPRQQHVTWNFKVNCSSAEPISSAVCAYQTPTAVWIVTMARKAISRLDRSTDDPPLFFRFIAAKSTPSLLFGPGATTVGLEQPPVMAAA